MFDTIVSLITPPLKGAVAVIRISGERTLEFVQEIFSRKIEKSHYVYYGYILNKEEKVDEVMLSYFKGPKSFTGEDVIEISCHGSMLIVDQIISLLLSKGCRLAERGEFTSRAFYNGRIDLVQAEAVNSLINAQTNEAKQISLFALNGQTSSLLYPVKEHLADILSLIEVNIDYPEYEDVEEMTHEKMINELGELIETVSNLIRDGEKSKLITEGINVSIVGRPNVGKSSLLNALVKKEKAIVTNIPNVQASKSTSAKNTTSTKKSRSKTVTVKSGDSLGRIASRNGTTVAKLRRLNGIKGDMIRPGQKIRVR